MDFSIKKLHFKLYKFVLSRPYPFDHWLLLVTVYIKLWFYSIFYSSIFCLIFETTFIEFMKIYFVVNFFLMIIHVFYSYKLELFRLIYDTIEQLFRMSIGRLFGLRPIDYNYKPQTQRNFLLKNILDFDIEKSKVFKKKYEEIDFLVLNDYITIEEGNKKTDELLKKEYGYGFLVTLDGHYETVKEGY